MTQPAATETPAQDVHAPPDGTLIAITYQGREAYLIPCTTCHALIPTTRADWWNGTPSTAIRHHHRWHDRNDT